MGWNTRVRLVELPQGAPYLNSSMRT